MTPEERARETAQVVSMCGMLRTGSPVEIIEQAIRQAIAQERERCARVAEEQFRRRGLDYTAHEIGYETASKQIAAAIRQLKGE